MSPTGRSEVALPKKVVAGTEEREYRMKCDKPKRAVPAVSGCGLLLLLLLGLSTQHYENLIGKLRDHAGSLKRVMKSNTR